MVRLLGQRLPLRPPVPQAGVNKEDFMAGPQRPQEEPPGFERNTDLSQVQNQVGAVSAIAREESELKAAIIVAKRFPRDEQAAYVKLLKSCERPSFAENSRYCFPRAGQEIEGPSIDMAREAARCWGNIMYGLRIVSEDEERLHIQGWAKDLETNNTVSAEDKFKKLIFRKNGGWQKPDERDLRELMNRRGAICVRNALLQLLPPDIIEDAFRAAKETSAKAVKGEIKQNRADAIRRLAKGFFEIGVTTEMLASYLKHTLDVVTEDEITKLRAIWKSLVDGISKREDYFDMPKGASGGMEGSVDLGDVARSAAPDKIKPEPGQKGGPTTATPPAPSTSPPEPKPAAGIKCDGCSFEGEDLEALNNHRYVAHGFGQKLTAPPVPWTAPQTQSPPGASGAKPPSKGGLFK
jgi:hypothetical protein